MLFTILIFVIVLGILVLVHEVGHFITAKKMGVRVDEFGIGFPPRLLTFKWKGTLYSLNSIPLGGFVKIKGEQGDQANEKDSFSNKKAWQRTLILSAGVIMNFVLAFVLFSVGFMIGMPQEVTDEDLITQKVRDVKILIAEVAEASPADKAGLSIGDTLISIDSNQFDDTEAVSLYIAAHADSELNVMVQRGAEEISYSIKPAIYRENESPLLGIGMIRAGLIQFNFFESIIQGFQATITIIILIVVAFAKLLAGLFSGAGVGNQISGPVGVAVLTGQIAKLGIPYLINFTAVLSINLGILNILPFPALDGGRIVFVILEKIKGRPISQKLEGLFHNVGFGLLILLVVFITYKDIMQYGHRIWDGLIHIFS